MCGITGIFYWNSGKAEALEGATQALAHRGPDSKGSWQNNRCALGHTRLAIIDTREVANQPMADATGRYVLVFNGEIFNFQELRNTHLANYSFFTQSDTEVLLALLIAKGSDALPLLNGFFAFAFYDAQEHTLLLARDRFGQKPLLYASTNQYVAFGSELPAVAHLHPTSAINQNAVAQLLRYSYIPAPHSVYQGISKLPPGTYAQLREGENFQYSTWYTLPAHSTSNRALPENELYKTLEQAVCRRLVADVPVGTFLSGGVDSSIITLLAARHHSDLHSFSVGFNGAGYFNEGPYAQQVAKHLGTRHHAFNLNTNELIANASDLLNHLDEPFADSSSIAMYALCRKTRNHVTVALSGDGADELFGGYRKHTALLRSQRIFKGLSLLAPLVSAHGGNRSSRMGERRRQIGRFLKGIALPPRQRYLEWCSFASVEVVSKLLAHSNRYNLLERLYEGFCPWLENEGSPNLDHWLQADLEMVLPNDMLKKCDITSMAHALEVRSPFLDPHVVALSRTLPEDQLHNGRRGKLILQRTFANDLPPTVFNRPKKGFEVPLYQIVPEIISAKRNGLFNPALLEKQALFSEPDVTRLLDKISPKASAETLYLGWALLVFQSWYVRQTSLKTPAVNIPRP